MAVVLMHVTDEVMNKLQIEADDNGMPFDQYVSESFCIYVNERVLQLPQTSATKPVSSAEPLTENQQIVQNLIAGAEYMFGAEKLNRPFTFAEAVEFCAVGLDVDARRMATLASQFANAPHFRIAARSYPCPDR